MEVRFSPLAVVLVAPKHPANDHVGVGIPSMLGISPASSGIYYDYSVLSIRVGSVGVHRGEYIDRLGTWLENHRRKL